MICSFSSSACFLNNYCKILCADKLTSRFLFPIAENSKFELFVGHECMGFLLFFVLGPDNVNDVKSFPFDFFLLSLMLGNIDRILHMKVKPPGIQVMVE